HACGELARHVHDGGARADSSPHTRTYSFLWSAHAGNLLRTCAMGVRVPVTRPTRGRTLFCGAHTRETLSPRARWGRACRSLAPHAHVLLFAERTRREPPPHARVLIKKQVADMYSDLDKLKSRVERRRIPISESSYFYSAYFSSSCV